MLISKLNELLLLESVKLYLSSWNELKVRIAQFTTECINVNNHHVAKLAQAIEALVNNQKKLAPATLVSYAAMLKTDLLTWLDSLPVHEVSLYLAWELMIACPNTSPQDRRHLIKQIVKKVNKLKDNVMLEKMLVVRRLPSRNVLIITNIAEIKK